MRHKETIKIIVDVLMGALFLLALAPHLTGVFPHEIIGVGLGVLFLAHTGLNIGWYKNLVHGPYSVYRGSWTAINLLLLVCMVGMIISGILISRHLFTFLPFSGGWTARRLHTLFAYWGFVLTALHVGLHGGLIRGALQKHFNRPVRVGLCVLLWVVALYGIKASFQWHIGSKLWMVFAFSNWDGVNLFSFLADHISIACLYAAAAYYMGRVLACWAQKTKQNKKE